MSQIEKIGKNYVSIENLDALHSIANLIRVFAYAGRLPSVTEISRNNLEKNWLRAWRADSSGAAFGKICIKIEKCRTKAADLRPPLFDI